MIRPRLFGFSHSPRPGAHPRRRGAGGFWVAVLGIWLRLVAASAVITTAAGAVTSSLELAAIVVGGVGAALIWLSGIRHLAMWAVSGRADRRANAARVESPRRTGTESATELARVALLYSVADDFSPESLRVSMA